MERAVAQGCSRREEDFNPRVCPVDVFVEMGFDDAVVVQSQPFAQRILRNLQPPIHITS